MKRFVSICLGAAMLLGLTACGEKKDYLEYFKERGYHDVSVDEVEGVDSAEGIYSYVDDREILDSLTVDSVDVTGLEGKDLNSYLIATKVINYEGEYTDVYSHGTATFTNGFSMIALEYKDKNRLKEVFESVEEQTSAALYILKITGSKDTYVYVSEDDYFSFAFQVGNTYSHAEYFIDDNTLVIVGGLFACKDDAYNDYYALYDYMGRDCSLSDLKFAPTDVEHFDKDAFFANPQNIVMREAEEVIIQ